MKQFTHHAWLHIGIASITIVYVIFGPQLYTQLFVRQGKPVARNVTLPPTSTAVQYALDGVDSTSSQGFYLLTGWAFQTADLGVSVNDYVRQIVLLTESGNYTFQTDTVARKFVQKFYSQYGLDVTMSGFSTLIYRDALRLGTYGLGLVFTNVEDHSTFFVGLDQCVTRTPNHLLLEDLGAAACRAITNNKGEPIAINSPIPDRSISVQMNIETLNTLENNEIYQLSGWAFPTADKQISSGSFERKIVLSNAHDDYFFAARTVPRFDVQEAFTVLGMDLVESGFTSIVSANALEKGSYHMGLIFTYIGDGKEFFVDANRCITLTEDGLVLVAAGTPGCPYPSP